MAKLCTYFIGGRNLPSVVESIMYILIILSCSLYNKSESTFEVIVYASCLYLPLHSEEKNLSCQYS